MSIFNTKGSGYGFDEATINAVWQKGTVIYGYDPNQLRRDSCGAVMRRNEYGNTNSKTGWEIDHIKPVSAGGSDNLDNLQPLQWQNNRGKDDNYPNWTCTVR